MLQRPEWFDLRTGAPINAMRSEWKSPIKILVVTGEASGDGHAARLVDALRAARPGASFQFFGSTGPRLRDRGVETVVEADEFAIIGLPEVLKALPMFLRARKRLLEAVDERKPDLAILVDFPEFNLKLAKALKSRGVRVVYYISPQLWAWRSYRARTFKRHVDRLISILPFEAEWYARRGVRNVDYVGNPAAAELPEPGSKQDFCRKHGLDADRPVVALLPGSRHKEVVRILPEMLKCAVMMRAGDDSLQFVVAMAPGRKREEVEESLRRAGIPEEGLGKSFAVVFGETVDALGAADAAAVASGTATLETAVIGTPLVVVYRSTMLNYLLLRPLVRVEHIGLVNLVAGRRLATELLQGDFTAERLSTELCAILREPRNSEVRAELEEATRVLKRGSASQRAAEIVLDVLDG
jgi:lipid-A-disaccharide synthase